MKDLANTIQDHPYFLVFFTVVGVTSYGVSQLLDLLQKVS